MNNRGKKALWIGAALALIVICLSVLAAIKLERRTLHPSVSCTKMACMPRNPCCNSCIHDGWASPYPRHGAGRALFGELPIYSADGCGQVDATMEAWGFQTGWDFNVVVYSVTPTEDEQKE